MTPEEAAEVYRKCDPAEDDCDKCPLGEELAWDVGDLGKLTFSLCALYQELLDGLKGVKA